MRVCHLAASLSNHISKAREINPLVQVRECTGTVCSGPAKGILQNDNLALTAAGQGT